MKLAVILSTLLFLVFGVAGAYAAANNNTAVGAAELNLLESIFTGNIGLTLGLAVAAMGIFSLVQNNLSGGIILIVLGVLITLLPGVYNGVAMVVCPIAQALGGHCGSQ